MYEIGYKCMECNLYIESTQPEFKCKRCGGSLEVIYDYDKMKSAFIPMQFRYMPPAHMKYYFALPLKKPNVAITMGEGGTPLIQLEKDVLAKFEGVNPTGAFKDRGSSVEISKAVELGKKLVVCASTGNMGASIAAYAAKAGIKAVIFTPEFAEPVKLKQMKYYGAKIIKGGKTYSEAMIKSVEFAKENDGYLTGDYPYRLEGQKTVAYEIADQMNFDAPDNIIIPVGNGTLFYATYKAFDEMIRLGIVNKTPRLIAVQASGCAPIVNAVSKKSKKVIPIKKPKTIASAINCDAPVDGTAVLKAIYETNGTAITVSDKESVNAKLALARKGIYAEVSSAAAYAGYLKLKPKGKTVIIITGIGFKDKY